MTWQSSCSQEIFELARALLREKTEAGSRSIRLLGVGLSNLDDAEVEQGSLFANTQTRNDREKIERAEIASDLINQNKNKK